ncbi:MAG: hypothetical protein IPP40_10650 [bacterium]|nr:hypothetical protein [bacterium]
MTPQAASVAYVSSSFPDGNNRLDPGDAGSFTVTMLNDGSRALSTASAILRSLNSFVSVSDSMGTYGNVNAGANASNGGNPFAVSALSGTPGGYQASMQLVAYSWIEIAPGLGGTGQSLGFTDGGEDQDDVVSRILPFTFQFYGQSYDTITVCSNGWIAFGSTTQFDYRNFHMGSPLGPANMIAAYWDDLIETGIPNGGVYVLDDAANGRCIIEWIATCLWAGGAAPQKFQVILYDPEATPSPTGDGKILVQYQDVNPHPNSASFDNDYATVGIQNINHTSGLEICYWNAYTAGSTTLVDGRAITFTTDLTGAINPQFALLSPNGGELWLQDSTVNVLWSPGLVTGGVNIELSRNGLLGPWTSIAGNTPNDGQFAYLVTGTSSLNCRVRVSAVGTPDSTDTSLSDFTIASIVTVLNETFESGGVGWTHAPANGWIDQWHISTEQAHGGASAYKCGDTGAGNYANLLDAQLTSPVVNNLPPQATLIFYHIVDSELSNANPDSAYDGGWVEMSVNGGPFAPITPTEGYPKTTRHEAGGGNPYSGPVAGQACYAGTISNWAQEQFNLGAYADSSIQLRWRFGSDGGANREGWYVDDMQIYGIAAVTGPAIPVGLTIAVSGNDLLLRWVDDDSWGYRIYSSITPDFSSLGLGRNTQTNTFTIPGGFAANAEKFYYVVGWGGH